ncbi:glycoside hydrolase family 88 protein [Athelia psychrophila]|uniref:Glycoside hydrolase family 88 protein n=1 Tax=Athelia psychrophila TaxID=1759441 RepID=A0A166M2L9_9AGAM|nr:glycoside hydrolase family 88 protein [Fibularhizoctonia sp. CBS 109695]
MYSFALPSLLLALGASAANPPAQLFSPIIQQKVGLTAQTYAASSPQYPEYTNAAGKWLDFGVNTWTTGFFPTTLYALNTRARLCGTSDGPSWLALGRKWIAGIIPIETVNSLQHDVGFVSYPFVEEYLLDRTNATARTAIQNFATDLANRYNPIVGCTRSWDTSSGNDPGGSPTDFLVITDNMMNLEVLYYSNEISPNKTLTDIAVSHADRTLTDAIRSDGSSYHLIIYNSQTGAVVQKTTGQGYSANSTWSRGQAWGIYGFANMYNRTGNTSYLDASRRMATYFLEHVPASGIVPWDFQAPNPTADSSATTITATGLLALSQLDTGNATFWQNAAIGLLNDVVQFWQPGSTWQSLLSNGTVNNHQSNRNNNTGIVYGDYYFIQAGNMLLDMNLTTCSGGAGLNPSVSSSAASGASTSAASTHTKTWSRS